MFNNLLLKKIYFILGKKNIFKLYIVLFLTLINTFFELITIGLIIPILAIFVDQNYEKYFEIFPAISKISESKLLIYIFIIITLIYLIKCFINIFSVYLRSKFCWNLYKNLSQNIFHNYIKEDYLVHINSHSSEKLNNIRGEASIFSQGVIWNVIDLVIDIILISSISIFLLFYNFQLSFFVIAFLIILGHFWNRFYNDHLEKIGKKREIHAKGTIKEIQNSFGNFRETTIFNLRKLFSDRFELHNREFSSVAIKKDFIIQIPRFLLELLSIIGVLSIFFVLIKSNIPLPEILVLLGVFVFAIVRMLPSVTKIIKSIQTIKFNNVVIDKMYNQLLNSNNLDINFDKKNYDRLDFKKISVKNLNYKYPTSENYILKDINLNISKGDKIGIVGTTGSGKSTLINIITGLLNSEGENFKIDDFKLNKEKILSWQSNIGYVSHDVFLLDETLGYNISLKENYKTEKEKLFDLLKKVELFEFVEKQPLKLDFLVGEKGGKLSRGQMQRLGIARALYINPAVLIFDEATSALDTHVERMILQKLYKNNENLTIISVSHRKSALEFCDKIFEINNGQLKKIVNK
tara:strand:- start:11129 stop:12859 length:1731 start_codon:yes stop_codon:yes gene_type:complete